MISCHAIFQSGTLSPPFCYHPTVDSSECFKRICKNIFRCLILTYSLMICLLFYLFLMPFFFSLPDVLYCHFFYVNFYFRFLLIVCSECNLCFVVFWLKNPFNFAYISSGMNLIYPSTGFTRNCVSNIIVRLTIDQ